MKKFIVHCLIAFFLLAITSYLLTINVYAVDSTPSADIRTKVEELKKQIASRAAKLKSEVNLKLQNKAYIGSIKTKSANTLTLASTTGSKIVTVNQDTQYQITKKAKGKTSLSLLEEEDYIAALGDIDEVGVLTAKKVILLPTTNYQLPTYLWGEVISISDKMLTILDKDLKSRAASFTTKTKIPEVKKNNFVIISGVVNDNEILEAKFIYVIPQGGVIRGKIATPSAKPATKSANPATTSAKKR